MKRLPDKKTAGFTLVELLVVISIIAILSVIGITIYSGIQKNARDSRRKADIDSIAAAMEANYGKTTAGQYDALAATFFSSGQVPEDPVNSPTATVCSSNGCYYCKKTNNTVGNCAGTTTDPAVVGGVPASGSAWMVCANLEGGNGLGGVNYYCRQNQQ